MSSTHYENNVILMENEQIQETARNNEMLKNKVVTKRVTRNQQLVMLDILLEDGNKTMLLSNFKGSKVTKEKKQLLWRQISLVLNNLDGCVKTPEKWAEAFSEWRSKVKNKLAEIEAQNGTTGGGIKTVQSLNDFEQKMANFISEVAVKGAPNIPVAGLDSLEPKNVGIGLEMATIPILGETTTLRENVWSNENKSPNGPSSLKDIGENVRHKRALEVSQSINCNIKVNRLAPTTKVTRKESIQKLVVVVENNAISREKHREKRFKELKRSNDLKEESNRIKREQLKLALANVGNRDN